METCHVLSGLARKCSLQVLSLPLAEPAASAPVQPKIAVKEKVSIPVCTTDEKGVTLHERTPSCPRRTEPRKDSPLSARKTRRGQQSLSSTPSPSGTSTSSEGTIELTPKQERMMSDEVTITRVAQEVRGSGGRSSPSKKRSRGYEKSEQNDESPAKRLANSMAILNRSSRSCTNSSSPDVEIIPSTTETPPRNVQTCSRNLNESFEQESLSSSPSSLNKPETPPRSSTCLSESADICAANMRSTNKCSGVGKSFPKSIKASPHREKKSNSLDLSVDTISSNSASSPKLRTKIKSSEVDDGILDKDGRKLRNCIDGDALINRVSAAVEESKIRLQSPRKLEKSRSASVENSYDSPRNIDIVVVDEEEKDVEMHSERKDSGENINREDTVDNTKSTQANFSPLDKKKYPYKKQCLLTKIKRLQAQNNSSTLSEKQEKTNKRKIFSNKLKETEVEEDEDYSVTASPVSVSETEVVQPSGSPKVIPKDKGQDVPLMANVEEVHVTHYVLDLAVDFEQKVMKGSIVLFLEPASEEVSKNAFQLCLDSTLVNVESVSEVFLPEDFKVPFFWRKSSGNSGSPSAVNTPSAVNKNDVLKSEGISSVAENTNSNDKKDVLSSSEGSELSLFQRLQKNYGIGSTHSESGESTGINSDSSRIDSESSRITSESNQIHCKSQRNSPESTLHVPECSRLNSESSRISPESSKDKSGLSEDVGISSSSDDVTSGSENSKQDSTLPGFLEMLGAKSSDPLPYKGLTYSVYGWCIKVWKEGATDKAWPRCVCIKYHTSPEGQSLMWTRDQDGKYVKKAQKI